MSFRPVLSSVQNPQVKQLCRLRTGSQRRKHGLFIIDGAMEILKAVEAGIGIQQVFSTTALNWLPKPMQDRLQLVSLEVMSKIAYGERSDQVLALARTPELSLENIPFSRNGFYLVLDQTEKPGNLGACLRTASACGVDAVILTSPICEIFNPNAIRASRGAIFTLPLAVSHREELTLLLEQQQIPCWLARVDGSKSLWQCKLDTGCAIVFGNEAHGLGPEWQGADSFRIPMATTTDSLNLSISVAVTLYETLRQRIG
ncbi:MAG: hypothetical protein KDB03_28625 [Planctomycetales bacterium]|nr:hypothetical protein [Planctomycetales bacterium]